MSRISEYYLTFILIFFQHTKLRHLIGQGQLLENKQMLRNIQDFVKFNNNQLADDMPETLMWKLGTYYKKI